MIVSGKIFAPRMRPCHVRNDTDHTFTPHRGQFVHSLPRLLNTRVFVFMTSYLYLCLYLCLHLLESSDILSESRDMYLLVYFVLVFVRI